MPPRDPIAEILAVNQRRGRRGLMPSSSELSSLKSLWTAQLKELDLAYDVLPTRIVTLIEVFTRSWIEILIDRGAPYVERAAKLKVSLKYDFAIARSLQGRSVSLGQIVSHSVSLSSLDSIAAVFTVLLDRDLFQALATTKPRVAIQHDGASAAPLIADVGELRKSLARLFKIRHILVNEFPKQRPYDRDELEPLFDAAIMFVEALDEELTQLIHSLYPLGQQAMNRAARERSNTAITELDDLCRQVAAKSETDTIYSVQALWIAFRDAETNRQSEWAPSGTMRPMVYHSCLEQVTRTRIAELKKWLEDWETD